MATDATTLQERNVRRTALREANLGAWAKGEQPALSGLDTSLKRNTAFIKRLRTGISDVAAILKEMAALRLDKYVSEVASAVFEGVVKVKTTQEVWAAIEVVSALHQRFASSFTSPFNASLFEALAPPSKAAASASSEAKDKDDASRITRQRMLIRLFGELEAVAVVKGKEGAGKAEGEELFEILKRLSNLSGNLPLVTAFCRHLGEICLPDASQADGAFPAAQKEKFKALLVAFFEALAKRAVKDRLTLLEQDKRNHEAYIRSGEIFEDRAQAYEKATKAWEKEWAGLQTLVEHLGESVTMPALPELPSQTLSTANVTLHNETSTLMDKWSDEEERMFYEDLPDLRDHLPPEIIGASALHSSVEDEVEKAEKDAESLAEGAAVDLDKDDEPVLSAIPATNGAEPTAPPARIDTLLEQLSTLVSREASDRLAIDIALQSRDKGNRKRAVKAFINTPRQAQAVLSHISRVIAILSQLFPDIAAGVLTEIGRVRLRTAVYLCELVKFGITPPHIIFHVFKACVDDLTGVNIEHFCALLEGCGRYLLRTTSTREKMQQMLDIAKRKQAAQNLDQRYVSMLNNAYTQCDPPERLALPPKIRSNTTLFINHLIYDLLSRATIDKVLKSLRKMHWEEEETRRKLFNAFSKPWKIRSSHLQLLALLLYDLKAHPDFQVEVIDAVLERIRAGLETNNYKLNQRRVADVKFLGELYNFRLVPALVVFDTLWLLLTFAHPDGRPRPDMPSTLDMPDDFFRARLLCVLLDTCHTLLDKGAEKKKIDHVLVFFEVYLFCKSKQPMDIGYMVDDLFETLRPKLKRPATFEEAVTAVEEMISSLALVEETAAPAVVEEEDDGDELDVQPHDLDEREDGVDDEDSDSVESDVSEEDEPAPRRPQVVNAADQADFDRDLAAMMASTSVSRPANKPPRFDVGLPAGKRDAQARTASADHTVFTMLSRRGGKPQTRSLEIPDQVNIAASSRTRQKESEAERLAMKRLVLSSVE